MAITVNSTPALHSAAYNQIVFDVSSNNTANAGFNFLIDVYVGGVRVNRQLYPKQPGTNKLLVDLSPVIKNFVQYDFLNASAFFSYNNNSKAEYYVQFGEAYTDASGILQLYPDLTRSPGSGSRFAYNAVFDFEDFSKNRFEQLDVASGFVLQDTNMKSYCGSNQLKTVSYLDPVMTFTGTILNGSNLIIFAQQLPPNILPGQYITGTGIPADTVVTGVANSLTGYIIVLNNNATATGTYTYTRSRTVASVEVIQYNSAGGLLATNNQVLSYSGTTYVYNINPKLITGFTLNANTAYYVVRFVSVFGDETLATYTIYVDNECSKFETYRLHWLNQYGGWEAFNFKKVSRQSIQVNRNQYRKMLPINYNTYDRLKTNYNTEIVDNIAVTSDWVSDTEAIGLRELFSSPVIWLERAANDFVAVQVTETNYETKTYLNNGRALHNITANIEFSYNRYRQSL
jgi:hypothetical protein